MKTMKKSSVLFYLNVIAVITLFIYGSAGGYESAAIQTCIEAWPGETAVGIRMMLTVPAIVQAVVMLAAGPLYGKKIAYRPAGIIGLALVAVGGTLPAFYAPTWPFVLICRGIGIGVGAGLLSMRTALLIKIVPNEDRGKWIGIASACASLLSMVFMPVAGMLAQIRWNYCFLVNILAFTCVQHFFGNGLLIENSIIIPFHTHIFHQERDILSMINDLLRNLPFLIRILNIIK